MKLFQYHLLKNLTLTTGGLGTILTVIIWLTQSLRFWKILAYEGAPPQELGFMLLCLLPNIALIMLPIGFLGALLWRFFRLIQDNERDILAGCGATPFFFMQPALYFSVGLSILLSILSFYLSPKALHAMKDHEHDLRHTLSPSSIVPGLFLEFAGRTLYVNKQLSPTLFQGIFIQDDTHPHKREMLTGRYAQIVQEKRKIRLFIKEGAHQQFSKTSQNPPTLLTFERYVLELHPKQLQEREQRLHEKTLLQLLESYKTMSPETKSACQKEIQQRLFLAWLPLVYCLWTSYVLLKSLSRKRRKRSYQPLFIVIFGVCLLEAMLLVGLDPKMSSVFLYVVYALYSLPFFLWIGMKRSQC